MIRQLVKEIHANAVDKGFWEEAKTVAFGLILPRNLMLIVSELGEALEADRKNIRANLREFEAMLERHEPFTTAFKECVKDSFEDELADVVIRVFDLCGFMGIDIQKHIELKMKYNSTRPKMHGKNY